MLANLFTQMEILSFERIAFAHSLTVADYRSNLRNQGYGIYGETPRYGGVLEIGFVEQNPVILTGDCGELHFRDSAQHRGFGLRGVKRDSPAHLRGVFDSLPLCPCGGMPAPGGENADAAAGDCAFDRKRGGV